MHLFRRTVADGGSVYWVKFDQESVRSLRKSPIFIGYNLTLVSKRSVFAQDFYEHVRAADPDNPSRYGSFG